MKTALQQYISRMEEMLQAAKQAKEAHKGKPELYAHYKGVELGLKDAFTEAQQYLPPEQKVIEKAYDDGYQQGELSEYCSPDFDSPADYYNQTFNDKNETDEKR